MSTVRRRRLGTVLIIIGLTLVLATGIYIAAQYPWGYLQHKLFGSEVEIPPDPAPLSVPYTFPGENTQQEQQTSLPLSFGQMLQTRPPMALTLLGTIKIPVLGVSENIVEGSDDEMLYAVGHIRGTAFPGQTGNCVLCAHRDYIPMHPFNFISKLQTGDTVLLTDADNRYTYEVFDNFSVKPSEVWVTDAVEGESNVLTMITCSPTYARREIIRARLIATEPLV